MDEDRGPGVTAVTWDGKNEAGEVVAAGVYTLVIDYGGRRDRRTVVVER
jgi:flagellar hook assembly protein FlgD